MNITTKSSHVGFTMIIKKIAEASQQAIPRVVDYEAGKIIERAIALTPPAQVAKIRSNAESREFGNHKTGYTPQTVFKGKMTKRGFKTYKYSNKYPDALWAEISAQRKANLERKLKSRGLSKQSWLRLAQILGIQVDSPAYVSKAIPPSGEHAENFSAKRVNDLYGYAVQFSNAQPTIQRINGARIISAAITGRIKYAEKNVELGVFEDIKKVAAAYPGLVTVSSS